MFPVRRGEVGKIYQSFFTSSSSQTDVIIPNPKHYAYVLLLIAGWRQNLDGEDAVIQLMDETGFPIAVSSTSQSNLSVPPTVNSVSSNPKFAFDISNGTSGTNPVLSAEILIKNNDAETGVQGNYVVEIESTHINATAGAVITTRTVLWKPSATAGEVKSLRFDTTGPSGVQTFRATIITGPEI